MLREVKRWLAMVSSLTIRRCGRCPKTKLSFLTVTAIKWKPVRLALGRFGSGWGSGVVWLISSGSRTYRALRVVGKVVPATLDLFVTTKRRGNSWKGFTSMVAAM